MLIICTPKLSYANAYNHDKISFPLPATLITTADDTPHAVTELEIYLVGL